MGRPEGTLGHSLDNDLRYGGWSKIWIEKVDSRPGWRELFAAGGLRLSVLEAYGEQSGRFRLLDCCRSWVSLIDKGSQRPCTPTTTRMTAASLTPITMMI